MAKTKPLTDKTETQPQLDSVVGWSESVLFNPGNFPKYNPDQLASRKGLRIYDRMMLDEQVKAVVRFKRDAVTARGWMFTFDKASALEEGQKAERIALFERIVNQMRGSFEDSLNAVSMGVWHGFSMTEKVHSTLEVAGKSYVGLSQLITRPADSFYFYVDQYGNLQKLEQQVNTKKQILPLERFVHYVHNPEYDRFYGRSDLREAYRSWYAKDVLIKFWLLYLERFGGGFAMAKRSADSAARPGTAEYNSLMSAITNLRNVTGMIVPPGIEIEVITPTTTDQYEKAITYHDLAIAKALLVPNLLGLSHTGQTGSYSQSQTQLEAFFWTLAADANRLAACLNEQLFRELGDWNFGDGDYPEFQFKPASVEHVKWVVSTWKDLVGAKAVQVTDEDEEHLRKLLEMPSLLEQDEAMEDAERKSNVDPSKALQGQQLTALLDVLHKVGTGDLPKAAAEELITKAFPITAADARSMLAKIQEGSIKPPEPPPVAGPPGNPRQAAPGTPGQAPARALNTRHDHGDGCAHGPRIVPDGRLFTASRAAFDRAIQRVAFAVIDRQTTSLMDDAGDALALQVAKAVHRLTGDEAMRQLLDEDISDIQTVRFDASDVSKLKTIAKDMLQRGWDLGWGNAQRELAAAKGPGFTRVDFRALADDAAAWLEANGFRMAGDLSDATRRALQGELLNGVKYDWSPQQTRTAIYGRLLGKGYTDLDSVTQVEKDPALMQQIRDLLEFKGQGGNVRAYLDTMTRTTLFEAMNEARYAYFTDPSLGQFVQALEYSAILDDRTTLICTELDGKVFRKDSPEWEEYRPPNHFNCRSVLIAVTEVDGWDGQESGRPH